MLYNWNEIPLTYNWVAVNNNGCLIFCDERLVYNHDKGMWEPQSPINAGTLGRALHPRFINRFPLPESSLEERPYELDATFRKLIELHAKVRELALELKNHEVIRETLTRLLHEDDHRPSS